MRWRKCNLSKVGIVVASALLLLVLMVRAPLSIVSAHQGISRLATPGTVTVQATPTEDATVTALNKEKLAQEVQQLKEQNEPDLLSWLRSSLSTFLSTLFVVGGGVFALVRYLAERRDAHDKELKDREAERDKHAEEQKKF